MASTKTFYITLATGLRAKVVVSENNFSVANQVLNSSEMLCTLYLQNTSNTAIKVPTQSAEITICGVRKTLFFTTITVEANGLTKIGELKFYCHHNYQGELWGSMSVLFPAYSTTATRSTITAGTHTTNITLDNSEAYVTSCVSGGTDGGTYNISVRVPNYAANRTYKVVVWNRNSLVSPTGAAIGLCETNGYVTANSTTHEITLSGDIGKGLFTVYSDDYGYYHPLEIYVYQSSGGEYPLMGIMQHSVFHSQTNVNTTIVNPSVASSWGVRIRNISRERLSSCPFTDRFSNIYCTGNLNHFTLCVGSQAYASATKPTSTVPMITKPLTEKGTQKVIFTARDDEGIAQTIVLNNGNTVNIQDYSPPSISDLEVYRCNSSGDYDFSGTRIRIKLKGTYSQIVNTSNTIVNTREVKYRIAERGQSFSVEDLIPLNETLSATNNYSLITNASYDTAKNYNVEIRIVDKFYGSTDSRQILTASVPISVKQTDDFNGVCFGGVVETDDCVEVKYTNLKYKNAIMNDFVVEQGTSSGWKYRKWNSGVCEAWLNKSYTISNISTAWYGLYISDQYQLATIPSGIFNVTPKMTMEMSNHTAYANVWVARYDVYFRIVCAAQSTSSFTANMVFRAVGTWK